MANPFHAKKSLIKGSCIRLSVTSHLMREHGTSTGSQLTHQDTRARPRHREKTLDPSFEPRHLSAVSGLQAKEWKVNDNHLEPRT